MPSHAAIGTAARQGFWATVVLAALCLAAAWFSPIAGLFSCLILLVFAWGIHRGSAFAAIAGGVFLGAPIVHAAREWSHFGLTLLIEAAFVTILFRAAWELWREPKSRRLWPWAPAAIVAGGFWLACYPFAVSAGSMQATLLRGDRILVESASWTLGRAPAIGDVVVIRYPLDRRQLFIKRVVAGPGDRIRIRNKQLYRNAEAVPESYATHTSAASDPFRDNFPSTPNVQLSSAAAEMLQFNVQDGEVVVPSGKYFVLGDNRDDSLDSRYWGFVSRDDILGSPVLIYDSFEDASPSPANIRWKRLLTMVR